MLSLWPDFSHGRPLLSRYRHRSGSPEARGRICAAAVSIDPNLAEAHVALGQIDGLKYDYAAGATKFARPYVWSPITSCLGLAVLGTGYEQPPEAAEAEKAAREAMRLEPASAASQYHLARAFIFQGRYQEAEVAFHRAGEIGEKTYENMGMAQLSLAQGNYDPAVSYV